MRLQPGGAGTTFYIGEARCNICYGQVCRMCTRPCVATLKSAMLLVLAYIWCSAAAGGAPLQGVVPCPLCAGYEDVMPPPDPDRPAGDADEPQQLSDDDDSWRRFGRVDIARAGHGW